MKIDLGKNELIHFVGIGGIGMSGLALIMNGLGYKVQGSDIAYNKNIEDINHDSGISPDEIKVDLVLEKALKLLN